MKTQIGLNRKVTIVGAGFSGLVSAYYLSRAGYDVEIYEKSSRVGGMIGTRRTSHGLVETAANGFLNSALVEDLFKSLNVPLEGASRRARKRFIFREGRARRWPIGFRSTLRVLWFGLRFVVWRSNVTPVEGESIEAWGRRVFGLEACRYLLSTALQGIYAGESHRMSARLILGRLFGLGPSAGESRATAARPIIRGSVAPPEGMGQLIDALASHLRALGVKIYLNASTEIGARVSNHPIIVATSPREAIPFVDPARATALKQIEMRAVTTTTAFFESTHQASMGFGVLFPPGEAKFLGVLKNGFIFSNRGGPFSETWIRAGVASEETVLSELTDERLRVFGLRERPLESVQTPWPEGIPHYTLELERLIPILNTATDNVFLMGNYLGDLGVAKILERGSRWPERLELEGQWPKTKGTEEL